MVTEFMKTNHYITFSVCHMHLVALHENPVFEKEVCISKDSSARPFISLVSNTVFTDKIKETDNR
jgi:hypothetical protein